MSAFIFLMITIAKPMSKSTLNDITIEKLITGGNGLGRTDAGMVVQVPFVIPGEKVRVREVKRHPQFMVGDVQEILIASPCRVESHCPLFGRCGGCHLQHISYDEQVSLKEQILADNLIRAGAISAGELATILAAPVLSPAPFGYRLRVRLQVDRDRRIIGFYLGQSHTVEPVSYCPIARAEINNILVGLEASQNMIALLDYTDAVEIDISPETDDALLIIHFRRKPRPLDLSRAKQIVQEIESVRCLFFRVEGHGMVGPVPDSETEPLIAFSFPAEVSGSKSLLLTCEPGGFSQVNQWQNEALVRILLDLADVTSGQKVLDLFCGMGNFSLPLALFAEHVLGMDVQRSAIRSAKRNMELNQLSNCTFIKNAAAAGLDELNKQGKLFDLVLLDPPRQGCVDVIPGLLAMRPRKIIYISCDPATLARDIAQLTAHSYKIRQVRLVDMFPQTHHLESISLLERQAD